MGIWAGKGAVAGMVADGNPHSLSPNQMRHMGGPTRGPWEPATRDAPLTIFGSFSRIPVAQLGSNHSTHHGN